MEAVGEGHTLMGKQQVASFLKRILLLDGSQSGKWKVLRKPKFTKEEVRGL